MENVEITVRYVIGTAPDDIVSPTPHVSKGSAERRLELMRLESQNNPPSWLEDLKIFKVTTTAVYEEC